MKYSDEKYAAFNIDVQIFISLLVFVEMEIISAINSNLFNYVVVEKLHDHKSTYTLGPHPPYAVQCMAHAQHVVLSIRIFYVDLYWKRHWENEICNHEELMRKALKYLSKIFLSRKFC